MKEYFTVRYEQSAYPAGMRNYVFPTEQAAVRFAGTMLTHPTVGRCEILDPQGKVVLDSTSKHKHTITWVEGGERKQTIRTETCPTPNKCPKENL